MTSERKCNNTDDISDFKPINITLLMSRVIEKVISAETSSNIHNLRFLLETQYGFTKDRFTKSY